MQTLSQLTDQFLNYLKNNPFRKEPVELYEPIDYIMGLGGKRLRPILVLMSYQLFKEDIEEIMPAAMAVEVFHNFSLVHDDIMDEAPLRRGKPTVHTKYDVSTGILSGDVMLILVYKYLMMLKENNHLIEILDVFNQVAIDVCEGQQMDMNFETQDDVQIEDYIKMISLKTAALIAGALELGALGAGTSSNNIKHISAFGKNIGIAFQLQDDILDTFGDPEKFGKKVGGDIAQNKKTYLWLKSLELANPLMKEQLIAELNNTDEISKIEKVRSIYQALNIREISEELKVKYQEKAFEHLDAIEVEDSKKVLLRNLAIQLLAREV